MNPIFFNTLVSVRFWEVPRNKHQNAHGFAREYLRSCKHYRPGQSLNRCGKSCSLN